MSAWKKKAASQGINRFTINYNNNNTQILQYYNATSIKFPLISTGVNSS